MEKVLSKTVTREGVSSVSTDESTVTPENTTGLEYECTPVSMRVADMCPDDKPRERALAYGVTSLSNAELIAIALGSGMPGKSVLALSNEILYACQRSLNRLSRMSIKEMCRQFKGMGPAKATALSAAIELGCRCRDEAPDEPFIVKSSRDAFNYVRSHCRNIEAKNQEEFWVLFMSRNNSIKCAEMIGIGGTNSTVVDSKVVFKKALDNLAEGMILVHNHPSGNRRPSAQDDMLTRKLSEGANILGMKVLDHLIIVAGSYYSYADEGRM